MLNYNYARFLPACLDSILDQSFQDFQVLVVDDCSSDSSMDIIERYRLQDDRITVLRHERNLGYSSSLIQGTQHCLDTKYSLVMSADDFILNNDAFGSQVSVLDNNDSATFAFSGFAHVGPDGNITRVRASYELADVVSSQQAVRDIVFRDFFAQNYVSILHSGTMFRSTAYRAIGGYHHELLHALDLDLWARLAMDGPVAYISEPLYAYREHATQMSRRELLDPNMMRETISVIDSAVDASLRQGIDISGGRRDAVQRYVMLLPTTAVFDARGDGLWLRALWASLRAAPREVATSRLTVGVLGAAVFGGTHWNRLRRLLRRRSEAAIGRG